MDLEDNIKKQTLQNRQLNRQGLKWARCHDTLFGETHCPNTGIPSSLHQSGILEGNLRRDGFRGVGTAATSSDCS